MGRVRCGGLSALALLCACGGGDSGNDTGGRAPSAVVDISTSNPTALNPGFSGFNLALVWYGVSYRDPSFRQQAAALRPGWLRYPAGTGSDAFDWSTGFTRQEWVDRFSGTPEVQQVLESTIPILGGKGGDSIADFALMASSLGVKTILCVNAFTDTPQSAAALARWARQHGLAVAAYELANEPFGFPDFFSGSADYATKMKPYRDAIKAVDPSAIVSLAFSEGTGPWNAGLASYPSRYWDAVSIHHYPSLPQGATWSDGMAAMNADLATRTTAWVTSEVLPRNPPGTKVIVSEFNPGNTLWGSLYAGIYTAEYLLRMSTLPQAIHVGHHQLCAGTGIAFARNHTAAVAEAYAQGRTLDTAALDWGYYSSAHILGPAIANGALIQGTQVLASTVSGGGSVAATGLGTIQALHGQAYQGADGRRHLVVTNKGGTTETVEVRLNGSTVASAFTVAYVSSADPGAVNTASNPSLVRIQTGASSNPVTVPPYCVLRLEWAP